MESPALSNSLGDDSGNGNGNENGNGNGNGSGNGNSAIMPYGIYHERQTRHLCGLHALNNLFQGLDMFSKSELDDYCTTLTPRNWLNPHRSWIGWGNYDVNVIMYALQQRNCEAMWFDRRRDPHCLNLNAIFGFILNVPAQMSLGYYIPLPFQMRHWLALRRVNGSYYNLDSKLREPKCLGNEEQFLEFLATQLQMDHELFLVLDEETDCKNKCRQRWLLPQFRD
ncbi:josephin-like protein [Drosophila mauritiana]|uniref:ubiquitinyl hydrolase 1 n=1 Tax=Drosophila mauritiana TaxID=7226 RepID=A0A6P8L130_DROMA|nr:josephin-like protein [Drosophila mauritiana]